MARAQPDCTSPWPGALRSLAAMLVMLGMMTACRSPGGSAIGTLEVRLSDHRVAIGDFELLDITLTSIDVHPFGRPRTEGWLAFAPQITMLDLTEYLGERQAIVLTTTLPATDYDAVRLVVAGGEGRLKIGGTAHVEGFSQAAALRFIVRGGQTTIILLDVLVESTHDHPGGGYRMNLLSAKTN